MEVDFETIVDAIISCLRGNIIKIPYFEYIGAFQSRDSVPKSRKGIYIFTAYEEISLSRKKIQQYNEAKNWNGTYVGAGFNYPFPDTIHVGDVYYLGKVTGKHNSIYQRLKIHFGDRTDCATNGIKMKMTARNFVDRKLIVHVFLFEKGNDNYYIVLSGRLNGALFIRLFQAA